MIHPRFGKDSPGKNMVACSRARPAFTQPCGGGLNDRSHRQSFLGLNLGQIVVEAILKDTKLIPL